MNADEWKSAGYASKARPPIKDADHILVIDLASHIGREKILNASEKAENIMPSPVLTRWHVNQIIEACEPVASERFFYSERH